MAECRVTPKLLERAAYERYANGLSWERAAQSVGICRQTLDRWRKRQQWTDAKAIVLEQMKHEGPDTAWGCLLRQAQRGDVGAAKEILNRLEGAVSQRVTHDGTGPDGAMTFAEITLSRFVKGDLSADQLEAAADGEAPAP